MNEITNKLEKESKAGVESCFNYSIMVINAFGVPRRIMGEDK